MGRGTAIERATGFLRRAPGVYHQLLAFVAGPFWLLGTVAAIVGLAGGPWVLVLGLAFALGLYAWRLRSSRTPDVLSATSDADSRVLLLRSFEHDDHSLSIFSPLGYMYWMLVRHPIGFVRSYGLLFRGRTTWDQALQHAVREIGPVVAIGEPGDRFSTIGQLAEYLPEEADWQLRVLELLGGSDLVVVKAGLGGGVLWEVGAVLEHADPTRVLIYAGERSRRLKHRLPSERYSFYREFRRRTADLFPVELPPALDDARFIGFDTTWRPVIVRRSTGHPREIVRIVRYMESVS
ncbi:MAG: hypothetical protein AAGD18_10310 [Actinomycetota bacterium]